MNGALNNFVHMCALFVTVLGVAVTAEQNIAKQFLIHDQASNSYQLVKETLAELHTLKGPIKVLSAIGDSRVGKSTNLNFVRYFWNGEGWEKFVKAFNTSNTMEACTEGVWMSSIPDDSTGGSVVFLDVEGTDLGGEAVTDTLSLFSAIFSSGVALFSNEMIKNHNINFLYRLSRLTDAIWNGKQIKNFPPLKLVFRGNLNPNPGVSLLEYVTKSILEPLNTKKHDEATVIGKYLTKDRLSVGSLPTVTEPKHLDDISGLPLVSAYSTAIQSLTQKFRKDFSVKKTASGAEMDGPILEGLAVQLVDAINKNTWGELPNSFVALEKDLCSRRYKEIVEPILGSGSLFRLESERDPMLNRFKKYCSLESELRKAAEQIDSIIKQKRDEQAIRKRAQEEEEERRKEKRRLRELEEKRKREIEKNERLIQEQRRMQQEAERNRRMEEQRAQEAKQALIREKQKAKQLQDQIAAAERKKKRNKKKKTVAAVIGTVIGFAMISDSKLKENVTTLPCSKYQSIGLNEVTWNWNEAANKELGLQGSGQGVVAQEVELLYPWAVSIGRKGYKKVNYSELNALVLKNILLKS